MMSRTIMVALFVCAAFALGSPATADPERHLPPEIKHIDDGWHYTPHGPEPGHAGRETLRDVHRSPGDGHGVAPTPTGKPAPAKTDKPAAPTPPKSQ
jgi:hypothetical protein